MENEKVKLGTYSNGGLSVGLANIEFSESDLEKMRQIIQKDEEAIRADLKTLLYRLDNYLKKKIGAIPPEKDFVQWFFDKKKITETGKKLPAISDEELIRYTKAYVKHLDELASKGNEAPASESVSFKWLGTDEQLRLLYQKLLGSFIADETTWEEFRQVFNEVPLKNLKAKIIWIKKAKNGYLNKKSISDFVKILSQEGFISKISRPKDKIAMLGDYFASKEGALTFTNSNLSSDEDPSENCSILEKVVQGI